MRKKIENAIEVLSEKLNPAVTADDGLKYSRAILDLTHALLNIKTDDIS